MQLAIIGAGNVGGALARAAVSGGHTVSIAAASPGHAEAVAARTGASAAASNAAAVDGADVVVLAVPYGALARVATELGAALDGKTVIDVANPLNETFSDLAPATSAAEELQAVVPGARVVKALNTILAARYANPSEGGQPLDAFYAGEDAAAKARVAELATSLGFRPVDSGGLRMARSLEEMAFLNITLNARNGWPWQSAWKLLGPTG